MQPSSHPPFHSPNPKERCNMSLSDNTRAARSDSERPADQPGTVHDHMLEETIGGTPRATHDSRSSRTARSQDRGAPWSGTTRRTRSPRVTTSPPAFPRGRVRASARW